VGAAAVAAASATGACRRPPPMGAPFVRGLCSGALAAVGAVANASEAPWALDAHESRVLLSRGVSCVVIAGSLVGKMPQVRAIIRASSAAGVSPLSVWTEMVSMGIQFAYNIVRGSPLSTFAEVPILFAQLVLLALVVAWANGCLNIHVFLSCFAVVLGCVAMACHVVPPSVTLAAYAINAALGFVIVLPQVIMNCQRRSTGRLSLTVTAMTFGGITSRVFTTFVEVDDAALRFTISLNWSLTLVLLLQFWVYRSPPPTQVEQTLTVQHEALTQAPMKYVSHLGHIGSSRCLTDLVGAELGRGMPPRVQSLTLPQRPKPWSNLQSFGSFRCASEA